MGFLINEKIKTKKFNRYYDIITQNYSKLVFILRLDHYLLYATLFLMFAHVDSQSGDIKRNNNVYDNLCVMIKKNVQSESTLFQ